MTTVITRAREEHGVVAANLAITIAFALFAVIMLTRTLLAANSIDDRVKVIVGEVVPIDRNLDMVAVLDDTAIMAEQILAAAQPLTGQAGQIVDITASIDNTGSAILDTATSINGVAGSINGNVSGILGSVGPINTNAREINSKVSAVNSHVASIGQGVADINGRADVIIGETTEIDNDLTNVDNLVKSIETSAKSICNARLIMGGC
jgi:methyl-accepting chemotaxis protein